jgi:hypothetical protein
MTGYVVTAIDVDGEPFGQRESPTAPTLAEAAELGELYESDYVMAGQDDGDVVTLYGREPEGSWLVIASDIDTETAQDMCLWFDLTHHYLGRSSDDTDPDDSFTHPLAHVPAPASGRMDATRAISLVVAWIQRRRLDYPTQGLAADRFEAGWSVYAPVDIDESDPMAFLDMPVGQSVFLVSDLGRVKEISSSIPPQQAQDLFTAEEAFVRRRLPDEEFMAELREAFLRQQAQDQPEISGFSLADPPEEVIAARASGLVAPITQQLALLGPPEWESFTAVFSFTVSGQVARLEFRSDDRHTEALVPEQIGLLARRQRHLAARMPAGPWLRLLLTVTRHSATNVELATHYDYGDEPLPERDLLAPEHYRDDLAAHPRAHVPAWLTAYIAGADEAQRADIAPTRSTRDDAKDLPVAPRHDQPTPPTTPSPTAPLAPNVPPADLSARVRAIGDEEGLGTLWGIYPATLISGARLGGFGIAAGVLALLGIIVLATADALGVILLAVAVVFVFYIVRGIAANGAIAGTCAATFESGVVYIDEQGKTHVFRWRSTTVRQRVVTYTRNGVDTRRTYEYELIGVDGAKLTLRGNSNKPSLANPEQWGREIQEGITHAQLPVALDTVAGGGTVPFGPIQVSGQGVVAGGRSVPWSDVEEIKVVQGVVSVRVAGKWLALVKAEVREIPNFFVFHALAEHLRALARDA